MKIGALARLGGAEHIGEKAAVGEGPVLLRHLVGGRRQPQHAVGAVGAAAVEPVLGAQLRKPPAQFGEPADEVDQIVARLAEAFPADPADLVVLAIGVVVAVLRIADLVAGEQDRHALRQHQAGELVLAQLQPQRQHRGIVGRALDGRNSS